ncbi:MAG: hypothetical protein C5B59_06225 [Bacteroidetes bacterium]|nr:MAG: hypothetical protein C5B59_06225 [Bacteroidota bacterium]
MKNFSETKARSFEKTCRNCSYFQNDPAFIEKEFAGLQSLSSGFASVRARDGICSHHQLYLPMEDSCSDFVLRKSNTEENRKRP